MKKRNDLFIKLLLLLCLFYAVNTYASYNPQPQRSWQVTLTSGQTANVPDGTTLAIINSSILLLNATIVLPPNPSDGMPITIESPKGITTMTVSPNTGQSVSGVTVGLAAANAPVRYKYSNINSTWYPN